MRTSRDFRFMGFCVSFVEEEEGNEEKHVKDQSNFVEKPDLRGETSRDFPFCVSFVEG